MNGIIFDFNGTMFFDSEIQETAWREYLNKKIGRYVTDEEFKKHIHGVNAIDTFKYFLDKDIEKEEVDNLEEEKEEIYRKLCLESPNFKLADGLEDILNELKAKEIPMTIATASNFNNVKFFFDHLNLDKWFDLDKVVLNDGTLPGKPNPDLFIKAAENINVPIENCIILEDSLSGIQAAKNAKAKKIIGVNSTSNDKVLKENNIDYVIKNFKDRDSIIDFLIM